VLKCASKHDENITVLWNQGVKDTEIMANRPDIITKNKKDNICMLTDAAIPLDRNIMQNMVEEKLKYQLCAEIQ
jgi:hypothetical protein